MRKEFLGSEFAATSLKGKTLSLSIAQLITNCLKFRLNFVRVHFTIPFGGTYSGVVFVCLIKSRYLNSSSTSPWWALRNARRRFAHIIGRVLAYLS
jgi:hypothetical protein